MTVDEKILFDLFSKYGYVISVRVLKHYITKLSRGFGFITFRKPREA